MRSRAEPEPTESELVQSGYRFALSLAHVSQDAEDLVQQAWLNLCRAYGEVTSRSLLFKAIRNLHIDKCRRAKIVAFESLADADTSSYASPPAEEPGVSGDLESLLGILRDEEREAIFLHYVEGYTAQEISELTGRPRGTVLSLLHRAMIRLRAACKESPGGETCIQMALLFVHLV